MDNLQDYLEAITVALAPDSPPESRTAGAAACRAILANLEPSAIAPERPPAPLGSPSLVPGIAALATAIRGLPMDQLLDLAIAKLRATVPADATPPETRALSIPLIPVPRP